MIRIEIKNLDKVIKKFDRLPKELTIEIRDAIRKSAFLVEAEVKPITPIDTGRLRGSISSDISPFRAVISPHVFYAIFVHEGTKNWPIWMPPKAPGTVRQFMKVGAEKAKPKIEKTFEKAIKRALNI